MDMKIVYKDDRSFIQDDFLELPDVVSLENDATINEIPRTPRAMEPGLQRIIIGSVVFALSILVALIISNFLIDIPIYKHGGVTSMTQNCSQIGSDLMRFNASNAIDALVATALCEVIQGNQNSGILGGGILIYRQHMLDSTKVYNFLGNDPKKSLESNDSMLAIPSLLKSLFTIHKNHGSLPWKIIVNMIIVYSNNSHIHNGLYIEILTNISSGNFDYFYDSSLIQEFVKQSPSGFPTMQMIKNYEVKAEKPIVVDYDDFTLQVAAPPSSGIILILFLNIISSLQKHYKINDYANLTQNYLHTVAKISDSHIGLFATNSSEDIVALLTDEDYANEIAGKIYHNDHHLPIISKFNSNKFFTIQTSNVVVIGPSDDMATLTMTLGLAINESFNEIHGLMLNSNNICIMNSSPIMFFHPKKPCFIRAGVSHQGTISSPTEIGRLIFEIAFNNEINLEIAEAKTMNASKSFYPENTQNCFISIGKFEEIILTDFNHYSTF